MWIATYPSIASVTDGAFSLELQLDEPGTYRYVVLADGAPAPTVVHVTAGTGGAGSAASVAGSGVVATANTVVSVTVGTGVLTASTSYDVWVFASDDEAIPNAQLQPVSVDVSTTADVTAPTFASGFPTSQTVLDFSFEVSVKLSEPGTVSYVVLPNGATSPTPSQVIAGTDGSGTAAVATGSIEVASTASAVQDTVTTGLSAATNYDVWFVAQDDESPTPNVQSGSVNKGDPF